MLTQHIGCIALPFKEAFSQVKEKKEGEREDERKKTDKALKIRGRRTQVEMPANFGVFLRLALFSFVTQRFFIGTRYPWSDLSDLWVQLSVTN